MAQVLAFFYEVASSQIHPPDRNRLQNYYKYLEYANFEAQKVKFFAKNLHISYIFCNFAAQNVNTQLLCLKFLNILDLSFSKWINEMVNRFLHKILVVLVLMSANLCVQAEELCMDGTLLFREDFGGNDPNDPVAGTDPAPGMTSSYTQIYDTATCNGRYPCTGMGSGRYLLTKVGYRNSRGYTYSHWFIMDDHTYPNDYTRGYLLEIDGRTDNATLFETVIDGLCEGSRLTFSAYVVNVTTSDSYNQGNNGDPQLSFVLVDPNTGAELATPYKTGPIPVDRSYQGMPGEWRNSAHWQLVGMNFTVPAGKTAKTAD